MCLIQELLSLNSSLVNNSAGTSFVSWWKPKVRGVEDQCGWGMKWDKEDWWGWVSSPWLMGKFVGIVARRLPLTYWEHVEAMTVREGVLLAKSRGFSNVSFVCDSFQIVSSLRSISSDRSFIRHVLDYIKPLSYIIGFFYPHSPSSQ